MAPGRKGSDRAESLEAAEYRLNEFENRWWKRYPSVEATRRNNWKDGIPMFAFAPLVGCPLSKTNAIEILNEPAECHQDTDPVPNGRAAGEPLVPALRDLESKWKAALKRLDILSGIGFERRMPESRFSHLHVPLRTAEAARIAPAPCRNIRANEPVPLRSV